MRSNARSASRPFESVSAKPLKHGCAAISTIMSSIGQLKDLFETGVAGRVMTGPRVFFYVQHLLGIGHLARASRIASALVDDEFDVTVVTGGTPVAGFPAPSLRTLALPPVVAGANGFSGLADMNGEPVNEAFKEHRRDMLLAAFACVAARYCRSWRPSRSGADRCASNSCH